MSLTATYVDASALVSLTVASAPANATVVALNRSTDQINWTPVRGATALPLTSGAASINDYEFTDGQVNYYQAVYSDTTNPTYVSASSLAITTSAGASASVTPALPSGIVDGDTIYLVLSCTKSTATLGAAITGFTGIWNAGQLAVYGARWTSGMTAPTITWTGLASGDIVMAKTLRYRNAGINTGVPTVTVVGQTNTAATTIAYPANPATGAIGALWVYQSSSSTALSGTPVTYDHGTGYTLGHYTALGSPLAAGVITVTGGSSAVSDALSFEMYPYGAPLVTTDAGSVTPALSQTWIKNPVRPYLNRVVTVINVDTTTRNGRTAAFDVIGRNLPVAVTDVMGARLTTVTVRTMTPAAMTDLETCLSTGEVTFFHAPAGSRALTGYFVIGATGTNALNTYLSRVYPSQTGASRQMQLPLIEVAAPSPTLAAVQSTWQTVINAYASWSALATALSTWQAVMQLVGSPVDVVVG